MENFTILAGYVAINNREYEDIVEAMFINDRLIPALMDRIVVRDDYLDHNKPRVDFNDDGVLELLKVLCPDEYICEVDNKITLWKAQKAAEAKGEEE